MGETPNRNLYINSQDEKNRGECKKTWQAPPRGSICVFANVANIEMLEEELGRFTIFS